MVKLNNSCATTGLGPDYEISGEMLSKVLVHFEHTHLVLTAEDGLQLIVSQDFPLVRRVLQIVGLDVLPNLAYHLGSRERG